MTPSITAEHTRLQDEEWRFFGPYLAERQWGAIREDYSKDGACWDYFPHDHARSRAYRWGEDALLGFSDREGRLCFGLALWNGRDPILKERLFGLGAPEGNHGEDVKELYYYLDSTPTHSYCKALYKYPLWAYPYEWLVREGQRRGLQDPEFELEDTGVFDRNRYIDVVIEYAKTSPRDVAIRITLQNRSGDDAILHVIPQVWFRNTWAWGRQGEPGYASRPDMRLGARRCVALTHEEMGRYFWEAGVASNGIEPEMLFTNNETNMERLFGFPNRQPYVKDAFHEHVVADRPNVVNPHQEGTKACAHYRLAIPAGGAVTLHSRLAAETDVQSRLGLRHVEETLRTRAEEADAFYDLLLPRLASPDERNVLRQGYASLLWSKQFYNFNVADWIHGDPGQPAPPVERLTGRNASWAHINNYDILAVPDKWEYPWYAAWDLAFHMIPFARVDPAFAREQLALFLSRRYQHPSGQLPAYEFAFGDVNPPVHAWACLRVHQIAGAGNPESRDFLESVFGPLVDNFRWWRSLSGPHESRLAQGGFLGLDNISAFDRGRTPPAGGRLDQADGTGWMAFFALNMLEMAIELGQNDPARYDERTVFFLEEFLATAAAINHSEDGLWDEESGFYFDHLNTDGTRQPIRVVSMVGLIPLFSVLVLDLPRMERLPRLQARLEAHLRTQPTGPEESSARAVLTLPSREQLARTLERVLDEDGFLAPTGIRSLSKEHRFEPFVQHSPHGEPRVDYAPEESRTKDFGPNSNWRGPVWFPLNHLLVEALLRHHQAFGDTFLIECPRGSGLHLDLRDVALEIEQRLASTFLADPEGRRPCHGDSPRYRSDPYFKDLILFYEYFSGETGRGLGASHQTGWTTLALHCIENLAQRRRTNS